MKKVLIAAALVVALAAGASLAVVASASRGRGPGANAPSLPQWFDSNGQLDPAKVPKWIGVGGAGGLQKGYVRGADLFSGPGHAVPLYDKPNGKVIGALDRPAPPVLPQP